MPITNTDLLIKYSATNGSAGNTQASSAAVSLGKYISNTQVSANNMNNLFNDITGVQNAANQVDYRCVFLHNNTASGITLLSAIAYISAEVTGGATIAIGVDPTGISPVGQAPVQALVVANSTTAPSGVAFSSPTGFVGAVALGNIPAGYCVAIWVRRTANNTPAVNNDGATLQLQGDTAN